MGDLLRNTALCTQKYSDFSEKIHNRALQKRIPSNGALELTLRCNLECQHCYRYIDSSLKELNFKEICHLLDQFADEGCLWLLLTGGEPLIRNDFIEIYRYAKNKGFILTLFTNGTLITPYIADFLSEYRPFNVEISLYGATTPVYEEVTRIKGSFKRCINGIDLLLSRNIPLQLKTMVTKLNHNELQLMKGLAKELGLLFRYDFDINPRLDGNKYPCELRLSPSEVIEMEMGDEKRLKEFMNLYKNFSGREKSGKLYNCGAGNASFHVDPYGRMSLCVIAREPSFDLRKTPFSKVWNEYFPEILQREYSDIYKCGKCEIFSLCSQCAGWGLLENKQEEYIVPYLCELTSLRAKTLEKVVI